ncbi:MAG: DUF1145 domain-containing protein [Bacilli bacterium]|nr:DUF1145 domain-containing protein [Bacilli bacterium]
MFFLWFLLLYFFVFPFRQGLHYLRHVGYIIYLISHLLQVLMFSY